MAIRLVTPMRLADGLGHPSCPFFYKEFTPK